MHHNHRKAFFGFPLLQALVLLGLLFFEQTLVQTLGNQSIGQIVSFIIMQLIFGFCLAFPHWQSWFYQKGKMRFSLPLLIVVLLLAATAIIRAIYYASIYTPWGVTNFTSRSGFAMIWWFIGYLLPCIWRRQEESGAKTKADKEQPTQKQWLGAFITLALIIGFILVDNYAFPLAQSQLQPQTNLLFPQFSPYNVCALIALGLALAFVQWRRWFIRQGYLRFSWIGLIIFLALSVLMIGLFPGNALIFMRNGWGLLWLLWAYFLPSMMIRDIDAPKLTNGQQKIRQQAAKLAFKGVILVVAVCVVIYAAVLFSIANHQRVILLQQLDAVNENQILYEYDCLLTDENLLTEKLIVANQDTIICSICTPHYLPLSFGKVYYDSVDMQYRLTVNPEKQTGEYQIVDCSRNLPLTIISGDIDKEGTSFTRQPTVSIPQSGNSSTQYGQTILLGLTFNENDLDLVDNISFTLPITEESGATAWFYIAQPLR